ncbi:hypothetical protein [Flavobacterium sp.]|jgi:hypothetical protein|uniref:hypothetical protein n=1 Tax=Flavobacterium sp. TaxID=239 RepID=UPI0037BE4F32
MKKIKILYLALLVISQLGFSQKKKIAVVTFYANKMVAFDDLGVGLDFLLRDVLNLRDNPNFNLNPILNQYHDNFFNNYSKELPFELISENEVLNNAAYQAFQPKFDLSKYEAKNYLMFDKYKYIYEGLGGQANEVAIAKLFADKADGVMFVNIDFALEKGFGVGSTATVKMRATTRMALYNKTGEKVFAFSESERSKKTSVMVSGLPIITPEKILPMCESALTELMGDLGKRIAKIVKKTEMKL